MTIKPAINVRAASVMGIRPESHRLWELLIAALARMTCREEISSSEQKKAMSEVTSTHRLKCEIHFPGSSGERR